MSSSSSDDSSKKKDDSSSSSSSEEDKKKKKKAKDKKKDKKKKEKKDKKKKKGKKKDKKKDKKKGKGDDFGLNARERARLEAQQRGMGALGASLKKDKKKKKKGKKKKGSSSSSSSTGNSVEKLKRLADQVEGMSAMKEVELLKEELKKIDDKPKEEERVSSEKPWDEMTWPERIESRVAKAKHEATWEGKHTEEIKIAGEIAREEVLFLAAQDGYMPEAAKKAKYNASKPLASSKPLSRQ